MTPLLTVPLGADEDPLRESGLWIPTPISPSAAFLAKIASGKLASEGAGSARQVRSRVYGQDQESWATLDTLTSGGIGVYCRVSGTNTAAAQGYAGFNHTGTGWRIFKLTAGSTFTQIGATDATVANAGDGIWLQCVGSTITLYRRRAGVWTQAAQAVDTTVVGSGRLGIGIGDATGLLRNFGGGNIAGVAPGIAQSVRPSIAPTVSH